jgi:hypothetical protein
MLDQDGSIVIKRTIDLDCSGVWHLMMITKKLHLFGGGFRLFLSAWRWSGIVGVLVLNPTIVRGRIATILQVIPTTKLIPKSQNDEVDQLISDEEEKNQ